ncbi:MAG TPA: sugar phosphate nucleotidyltransferase, partial [Peptostreptococcaceae bacterium]|nr:sugar phosphate nucleotidyltransferase [Peptostreptococcaceae bacterium]
MLNDEINMVAYPFKGYWRDVGTIDSLWQANMDLINTKNNFNLYDSNWKIYTEHLAMPPQYIGKNSKVDKSILTDGAVILGDIENSVISYGVRIGEGSIIKDSVIMPNVKIGKNVIVNKAMIGEGAVIKDNCNIDSGNGEITVIGEKQELSMETELA